MRRWLLIFLIPWLAACGSDALKNENDLEVGAVLYDFDFEDPQAFETGDFPTVGARLSIQAGRYRIEQSGERAYYIWGQGGDAAQDVVIEVEAQAQNSLNDNLYGVMCRVDAAGAGYVFLEASDGYGAIARTDGRSLSFIVDWRQNTAIHLGQETNTLRAICVGDYLALYVNDHYVADVTDQRHSAPGQVGLMAGIFTTGNQQTTIVDFDNLTVSAASLKD
jgi:hypothetical protein